MAKYLWLAAALFFVGCNRDSHLVSTLDGPGGDITLGGSLAEAQKAFPPPAGAQVITQPSNFAPFKVTAWGWVDRKGRRAVEFALRKNKVAAISDTQLKTDEKTQQDTAESSLRKLGTPASQATGKTVSMYGWNEGKSSRILLLSRIGFIGSATVTLLGSQDDLKLLNYHADDVATTVRQLDLGWEGYLAARARQQGGKSNEPPKPKKSP